MDYSATFARHFARLVSLLMHEVGNVDEQKVSLRALVALNKNGAVAIAGQDWQLLVNDQPVPGALTGVNDVAAQMAAHSVVRIQIGPNTVAADLLGVARIVAMQPKPGDGGDHVRQKVTALGAKTVEFVTLAPAPVAVVAAEAPTAPAVSDGRTAADAMAARLARGAEETPTLLSQLTAPDVSKLVPEELLKALDSASNVDQCTKVLDDLVSLAEHSVRVGKAVAVGDIFYGVVKRDAQLPDGEIKRAYVMAIRRMSKPALLRAVATLIPKKPERKQHFYEVLARTAEDGADALIEQISQAQTSDDRKTLFEVLGELPDAVPALIRMLGDSRWFVVRNAADLLGEMAAKGAEDALIGLLRHTDDRVRRSATNALLKLGTPDALKAIYEAVSDSSPEVRMQAAAAISTKKDGRTAITLIRAIEDEQDPDVQLAMIAALGRVATPDAVAKLVKMAEPEGRLFRKKATTIRVAAVQALGEAKTPAALASLKELVDDKDREVRDTATRALAQAGR
ncbi:MAG: HEAT repeat domain-containing protein [Gemmatimonadaceae bacterium]